MESDGKIPVLITVDVCDGSFDTGDRTPRFDDLMGTLPGLKELLSTIVSEFTDSDQVPITWFLRADEQVSQTVGSVDGLYSGWLDFWEEVASHGGEVGWHPHLFIQRDGKWIPPRDNIMLRDVADRTWAELESNIEGWRPTSCRMGEALCSNELMRFLNEVGFRVDSSALPGRRRMDNDRWFDWYDSPHTPYHPSKENYRVTGEDPLGILEVPFTMAEIRAEYDNPDVDVSRYLDLSYDPEVFAPAVTKILPTTSPLVTVIHPMQAAGMEIPSGGLVKGGLEVVKTNLQTVFNGAVSLDKTPVPVTLIEFAKQVP